MASILSPLDSRSPAETAEAEVNRFVSVILHGNIQDVVTAAYVFSQSGGDVNGLDSTKETLLRVAAHHNNKVATQIILGMPGVDVNLISGFDKKTALNSAVDGYGNTINSEVVSALMAHGADPRIPDKRGVTPLHFTVDHRGHDALMCSEVLIAGGADVNAVDKDGWTPLHRGVMMGNLPIIELLLDHGADPNACTREDKSTPMHYAACMAQPDVLATLLFYGADPNAPDNDGKTSLHHLAEGPDSVRQRNATKMTNRAAAALNIHKRALSLVLAAGGNPYLRDSKGHDAVETAKRCWQADLAGMLDSRM